MPTFNDADAVQWRSWQPENLLNETPEVALPTLDSAQSEAQLKAELARLRQQAEREGHSQGLARGQEEGRQQGYEAGLREGREAGFAQGLAQAGSEQQAMLKQAEGWLGQFSLALENLDSLIPGRLVQLALTAVQQLYGSLNVADNHALVTQIRKLMKKDALLHGTIELHVNPQDFPRIEQALGDTLKTSGWVLHRDAELAAGGCRIVTPDVEFDASMETRWQALCQLAREELSQ
ncbi:flagellar assembly protein FliH [Enterobacter sp. CC120223-11]|uniref:flagellar assembly protein FliH n=1 Tax=Enterobacter sp. CC120223-11 TaxID=1378073 RepID=UPI000BCA287A|nr:flagellar assembly protein FliH [Enterobacter sp. CC120223-11]SNY67858.1 flagellar assembly protein FliH [Enterobacter sp. CC120223-11]